MDDYGVSLSSPSSICEKYDVFLSFRGEDMHDNFISHLSAALKRKRIKIYIDEEILEKGDDINLALPEEIQKSKIAIIIFSKDYASSTWCLRELEHILKCRRDNGQILLPIFYRVDPSDIQKQKGSYAKSFIEHENRFKDTMEMVDKWRVALTKSADLSGWNSQVTRPDTKLIEEVVEDVLKKLQSTVLSSADGLKGMIGMEKRCEQLESLLSIGSANTRIISLWGMGGIGKTTLANAVYGRFFSHFESYCFLKNVRGKSEEVHDGLEKLRNKLFAKLLGEKAVDLESPSLLEIIKRRLRKIRVLIVLDDVSKSEQLEHLVGDGDLFASGSRILLTTRDQKILRIKGSDEVETSEYEVEQLNDSEALDLFNFTAFDGGKPPTSEYAELSKQAVSYAGCNPLAIKVVGSELRSLREPNKEKWKMTMKRFKMSPPADISEVLKISYEGLKNDEKNIFLDIACFFKGMCRDFVQNILNACSFSVSTGLDNLIGKSLITIDPRGNKLQMHDLMQEIGRDIICQEFEKQEARNRLWIAEHIIHVLENNIVLKKLRGIDLSYSHNLTRIPDVSASPDLERINLEGCVSLLEIPYSRIQQNLNNLIDVNLRNCNNLRKVPDRIFDAASLRSLTLKGCSNLYTLPTMITARSLVSLDLSSTAIETLSVDSLQNLSELCLVNCEKLSNLSGLNNLNSLKCLHLQYCSNLNKLSELPSNIEDLNIRGTAIKKLDFPSIENFKLRILELSDCSSLESLPPRIFELRFLGSLFLFRCTKVKNLPDIPKPMESLTYLCIAKTKIGKLPSSFGNLIGLRFLIANDCEYLEFDPEIIFNMPKLATLELFNCPKLGSFTFHGVDLVNILVKCSNLKKIPESIKDASKLRRLLLKDCRDLRSIPAPPMSLESLDASGCTLLEEVSISERALTQEFENNYPITKSALILYDCLKLGQKALDNIITEFRRRVLRMATRFASLEHQEGYPIIRTCCCPGNEIPEWFNHQSEGRRIEIMLPHNNFLGFVLCAVGDTYKDAEYLDLVCELQLQGRNYSRISFDEHSEFSCELPTGSVSDHLYMWFEPQDYSEHNYTDEVTVSFEFSFIEYDEAGILDIVSPNCQVKKCGIHVLYSKDLKKCNLTPSEAKEKARNKSAATLDKSKSSGPTETDEFTTLD
ncbi:disease resistance-like protein DSC1 [Morus notabilis]|uniref:disease resistance-like protein DSC1 n=1 Tax=Morus notabilis TaxID=981085 RepID=UPI000CED3D50|nr:disease resistance-like protein DSC1 [Morus notabilis]